VTAPHVYQKDAPLWTPKWIQRAPFPRREGGKDICDIVIDDLPTLVWCANMANLEIHPFLHCARDLQRPTETRPFARSLAEVLEREDPGKVVSAMAMCRCR
jgi:DNA primase